VTTRTARPLKACAGLLLLAVLALAPASRAEEPAAPVAKISITRDGAVSLDGHPISPADLKDPLARLAERKGEVWYYRENAGADPPPEAMAVIQAIIDAHLPVRLSTKPDFSEFTRIPPKPGQQ